MAKVALLIGVSEYEPGLNPLPAAVKDIEAIQEVLLDPKIGGFTGSDITSLKNPDRQVMEEAIYNLFASRNKDDLLLLFFSGHGIKDDAGKLYLATRSTRKTLRGELISPTAVEARFVHDCMSRSRSKRQVVVLDSCFSGAFAEGLSAKDDGTVDVRTQLGGEGRAVLTSSSSTQYSFEQEGEELSLYTRFLIEGMRTGEADLDGDEVISIDELHEYASRKVREVKPELRPEIYAIREGFKIRLVKVPPGDPVQMYRKEVARFINRGEISFVGRRTLDVFRTRLGLEAGTAAAIEDEVLEPYRKDFRDKLQQYEQVFRELSDRDEPISEGDHADLQNLQQLLGLRNEDTVPIEAQVTAALKAHKQNLQAYKQALVEALRHAYPLSETQQQQFRQRQQQMALTNVEVEAITAQVTAAVETHQQHLHQYEQTFAAAVQQQYPLSEAQQLELQSYRESLGLGEVDVAPVEAKITTEIKTYQQKLQQYKEAFVQATQSKYQPSEVTYQQLQQTWHTLGLVAAEVQRVEAPILAQIERHQTNLRQYEQAFTEATQQQYPLGEETRLSLQQRQQQLNLSDEDVAPIQISITTDLEEHLQKLEQYQQVLSESIQFEYPLSEPTREEIQRFQQVLELSDEDATRIEAQLLASQKIKNLAEEPVIELPSETEAVFLPQASLPAEDGLIGLPTGQIELDGERLHQTLELKDEDRIQSLTISHLNNEQMETQTVLQRLQQVEKAQKDTISSKKVGATTNVKSVLDRRKVLMLVAVSVVTGSAIVSGVFYLHHPSQSGNSNSKLNSEQNSINSNPNPSTASVHEVLPVGLLVQMKSSINLLSQPTPGIRREKYSVIGSIPAGSIVQISARQAVSGQSDASTYWLKLKVCSIPSSGQNSVPQTLNLGDMGWIEQSQIDSFVEQNLGLKASQLGACGVTPN